MNYCKGEGQSHLQKVDGELYLYVVMDKKGIEESGRQETILRSDNKWECGSLDTRPYPQGTVRIPLDFLYRKNFHIPERFLNAEEKIPNKKREKCQQTGANKNELWKLVFFDWYDRA